MHLLDSHFVYTGLYMYTVHGNRLAVDLHTSKFETSTHTLHKTVRQSEAH